MSRAAAVGDDVDASPPLELELPIEGMTCTNCAHRIEQELNSQAGVTEATVSFATRRARIVGYEDTPGKLASGAAATVGSLGYAVPPAGLARLTRQTGLASESSGMATAQTQSQGAEADAAADAGGSTADDVKLAWHDWPLTAVLAVGCWLVSMVDGLQFAGWRFVVGAAASVALWWGGRRVLNNAWIAARHRSTTMDTLISLGALTAWTWSAARLVSGSSSHLYFDAAAVILAFVTLGRWLEDRAMRRTGDAVRALAELTVPSVRLVDGTEIDAVDLAVGMQFVVRPGDRVATDGIVAEGTSAVDVSMMTGEPVPVDVAPGDEVVGGTQNGNGVLVVRATAVGADTALARITDLTRRAQDSRADVGRLADRVSAVFVPIAVSVALMTFVAWLAVGGLGNGDGATLETFGDAVTAAVAVLVISCPCALGLATPVALAVGVGRAAQLGALVRGAGVFEDSRHVDAVVFDKTGTVTRGQMTVTSVAAPAWRGPSADADGTAALLELAACAESASEHPIGRAIAATSAVPGEHASTLVSAAAVQREHAPIPVSAQAVEGDHAPILISAEAVPGLGVRASVRVPVLDGDAGAPGYGDAAPNRDGTELAARPDDTADRVADGREDRSADSTADRGAADIEGDTVDVCVGKRALFASVPDAVGALADEAEASGATAVLVGRGSHAEGVIVLADGIEPTAAAAVAALRTAGVEPHLLTGDNECTALAVAAEIGIDNVTAGVLPEDKAAEIARLQADGARVAMVGDGINDAAALATADVGIAAAAGTDIARSAADITLLSRDLRLVPATLALSRRILRTIQGNLFWAFAYNVAAIPLAATGVLDPMLAAGAMAASSLFVVGNSLRLRRFAVGSPGTGGPGTGAPASRGPAPEGAVPRAS